MEKYFLLLSRQRQSMDVCVAMCSCVASDTLIDEVTDANLFLSPCSSACSCLPTESPGTEQLGFTSGR